MPQAYRLIDQPRTCHNRVSPLSRPGNVTFGVATFMVLVICFALSVAALSHAERNSIARSAHRVAFSAHRSAVGSDPRDTAAAIAAPGTDTSNADSIDLTVYIADLSDNLARLEDGAGNLIGYTAKSAWNNVRWLSDQMLALMDAAGIRSAGSEIFPAFSSQLSLIATALTVALMVAFTLCLTAPFYAMWKSWRMSRVHVFRYH